MFVLFPKIITTKKVLTAIQDKVQFLLIFKTSFKRNIHKSLRGAQTILTICENYFSRLLKNFLSLSHLVWMIDEWFKEESQSL